MPVDEFTSLRWSMVQIVSLYVQHSSGDIGKDALDDKVMHALGRVPRHDFVPSEIRPYAYHDGPLPIGYDKTISQPFIAALMTDLLDIRRSDKVLEIGTGLGYHAALMSELAGRVYSVEIIEELAAQAQANLEQAGYGNVELRIGDGSRGWPQHAPFDRILVAAASELIPPMLLQQLAPGGRMVIPTGIQEAQRLTLVEKDGDGRVRTADTLPVRFALLESYH
jgi:protein-L-isoaspartate(D-aspartate) O-methyltransferase